MSAIDDTCIDKYFFFVVADVSLENIGYHLQYVSQLAVHVVLRSAK